MWERLSKRPIEVQELFLDEALIRASYERCSKIGLDPDLERLNDRPEGAALEGFLARHASIMKTAREIFSGAHQLAPDPACAFVLANAKGRMIDLFSLPELISACAEKGMTPGVSFSEKSSGTNAIALVLEHCRPVVVKGRQHFCRLFHDWYCVAVPILDGEGEPLGCVDFSAGHEAGITEKLPLLMMLAEKLGACFARENSLSEAGISLATSPVFSSHQMNILTMVAKGLTSKEIGALLEISARTVETHLERMRMRVKAKTTAQLVALALRSNQLSV